MFFNYDCLLNRAIYSVGRRRAYRPTPMDGRETPSLIVAETRRPSRKRSTYPRQTQLSPVTVYVLMIYTWTRTIDLSILLCNYQLSALELETIHKSSSVSRERADINRHNQDRPTHGKEWVWTLGLISRGAALPTIWVAKILANTRFWCRPTWCWLLPTRPPSLVSSLLR